MKLKAALLAGLLLAASAPPAANAHHVTSQDVINWTYAYSSKYGVGSGGAEDLLRIARCESRLNPHAVGRLGEVGPYQFHPRGVWSWTPQAKAGYSIYDVEATVAAAAWLYANGYAYTTLGWYWCSHNG